MKLPDKIIDHLTIDLEFVLSDLVDLNITEEEIYETAYYDALAQQESDEVHKRTT